MAGRNYFLASALPSMGELGAAPPWTPAALLEHVREAGGPVEVVTALLLGDDLLQRDALLAGEIEETRTAVLTPEQAADEAPLPAYLVPGGDEDDDEDEGREVVRHAGDAVWLAWFRHAAEVGKRHGGRFLGAWIGHEVALRNALATARAKALGLDPADYLVATDLAEAGADFSDLVADWAAAPDPLAGQRLLDQARWGWLKEHEAWFSFGADEVAAYAAKLMLIDRWHRVGSAGADRRAG
ncbi:MAG TPA: DUF2764 family protein [Thermoanaerobaculales bacterium]|nr:DUF2764 family protein [Thermoanaerobaculales bacterium]HPA81065.1 DUF2764 family protein [Thermoanaerobaculales bacterium]HQL29312.1 DUF2764 family protein [Thermoanaerobaculales bacterium]